MKTRDDLRKDLCVSSATIGNWVKTGVVPAYPNGKYFEERTYAAIVGSITSPGQRLQTRANRLQNHRRNIHSTHIPDARLKRAIERLSRLYESCGASPQGFMLALSILRLKQAGLLHLTMQTDRVVVETENPAFTAFLKNWMIENTGLAGLIRSIQKLPMPPGGDDFLGTVYECLRTLGEKAKSGAFFTPSRLVEGLQIPLTCRVLDPCAGTGTILLHLVDRGHDPEKITLRDIDQLALKIAKVNFALHFDRVDKWVCTEEVDILRDSETEAFDLVITNPPWGARFSSEEKYFLRKKYPDLHTAESFSIALHNGMKKLSPKGRLVFILPESMLYVDAHTAIRRYVFEAGYAVRIRHFGHAFRGVMSKVIRLELGESGPKCEVSKGGETMDIPCHLLQKNNYRPPLAFSRRELPVVEKILNTEGFYLKNKCRFGLGIVTGNNAAHLHPQRLRGMEPVFTGKEIAPCQFKRPRKFIFFDPAKLQQVAPPELYRQPKICYRFISNAIVTVADFNGSLLLNSANFLLPDASLPIKALSAFLNAPVVTFAYQRLFNATKVLRGHLEAIPIPKEFYDHIEVLTRIYDELQRSENSRQRLHQLTCRMYGLTPDEGAIVCRER